MMQTRPPVESVETEAAAGAALLALISGFEVTQALAAAAELGLADQLAAGPRTAAELATATGTHAPWLERLLRYLAAFGVLLEDPPGQFAATPRSDLLRRDHPRSLWAAARFFAAAWFQAPYAHLAEAIRTGQDPFARTHGTKVFPYLAAHPEAAALFNTALTTLRAQRDAAVAATYNFAGLGTVVDVAGGYGNLLVAVLQAYPTLRGVLFDRPSVVDGAGAVLTRGGVADRCRVVGGDMFVAVPRGVTPISSPT